MWPSLRAGTQLGGSAGGGEHDSRVRPVREDGAGLNWWYRYALFGFWNWNWDSALSRILALPVSSWRNYCRGRGNSLHPTWTEGRWSRISGSWRWTGHSVSLCSYFFLSKNLKPCLVVVCLPDRALFLQSTVHFPVPAGQQWVWPWKAVTAVHSGSCWSIYSCWHKILFLPFFSRHSSFQQ